MVAFRTAAEYHTFNRIADLYSCHSLPVNTQSTISNEIHMQKFAQGFPEILLLTILCLILGLYRQKMRCLHDDQG